MRGPRWDVTVGDGGWGFHGVAAPTARAAKIAVKYKLDAELRKGEPAWDLSDMEATPHDERRAAAHDEMMDELAGSVNNPAGLTAKRAATFRDDGLYDVFDEHGAVVAQVCRDPENREWYEEGRPGQPQTHYTERWLGSTLVEALERLTRRHHENPTRWLPVPGQYISVIGSDFSQDSRLFGTARRQGGKLIRICEEGTDGEHTAYFIDEETGQEVSVPLQQTEYDFGPRDKLERELGIRRNPASKRRQPYQSMPPWRRPDEITATDRDGTIIGKNDTVIVDESWEGFVGDVISTAKIDVVRVDNRGVGELVTVDPSRVRAVRRNPAGLTAKGERMYEHIRDRYRGSPRAEEIASRTVLARARTTPGLARNPSPELRQAAIDKFTQFHRYPPIKIEEFHKDFKIPELVVRAGRAKWTTYLSGKVDPATLQKPKRPVSYIHEHNAGVHVYLEPDAPEVDDLDLEPEEVAVPRAFYATDALVKLGDSLGFCVHGERGAEDAEFEFTGTRPELYCVPDGTCLLIVQDRREVIAMIWGGALGVFGRGIDG